MATAEAPIYKGWVQDESESRLVLTRRSTGATITATRAGISFEGNHQNATGVEDAETVDVLRQLIHFHDDVVAAHNVGAKAAAAAIADRREKRASGSSGSGSGVVTTDRPASASNPATSKGG